MKQDFNITFMDDMLGFLTQTDEWARICNEDPQIQAEEANLKAVVERVKPLVSKELWDELYGAVASEESAYIGAAILFGMRVPDMIRNGAARQIEVSQHILERIQ